MLISNGDYIFLEKEDKVSQKGMPYSLVKFADVKNYEKLEYYADTNIQISAGQGAKCKFTLKPEKRGFKTEHSCIAISAV